jgi:hypothetical protein
MSFGIRGEVLWIDRVSQKLFKNALADYEPLYSNSNSTDLALLEYNIPIVIYYTSPETMSW